MAENRPNIYASSANSVFTIDSGKNFVPGETKSLFKQRRRLHPALVLLLVILFGSLCISLTVVSLLYYKLNVPTICDTERCLRTAASLKAAMNTNVDPCDDFVEYTCGRWSNSHSPFYFKIPKNYTYSWFYEGRELFLKKIILMLSEDSQDKIYPKALLQSKIFYSSCTNPGSWDDLGLEPLFSLFQSLSLPRSVLNSSEDTATNVMVQTAKIERFLGVDLLFGIYIDYDHRNKSKYILKFHNHLTTPMPTLKNTEDDFGYFTIGDKKRRSKDDGDDEGNENVKRKDIFEYAPFISMTKKYMKDVVSIIISLQDDSENEKNDVNATVEEIFDFYSKFRKVHLQRDDDDNEEKSSKKYYYIKLKDLQKVTDSYVKSKNASLEPKIIWTPYFEELFSGVEGLDLNREAFIRAEALNYLKHLAYFISVTDNCVIEKFLWWSVIDYSVPHLTMKLRGIYNAHLKSLQRFLKQGTNRHSARNPNELSFSCLFDLASYMDKMVSWYYLQPIKENAKLIENGRDILEKIKIAFTAMVLEANWLDEKTKIAIIDKSKKMTAKIGYPDWLFKDGEVDKYYDGIDLSFTNYFQNRIQLTRRIIDNELLLLLDSNSQASWPGSPAMINAFQMFMKNEMVIPAGILQFPFYDLGLEVLNYGAVGAIMGHELTHGFDNTGRLFDSSGLIAPWWTNETVANYARLSQCFVDQYSRYHEKMIRAKVDGQRTLGENIADNGGLKETYYAYQLHHLRKHKKEKEQYLPGFTHLTHEQLLFLSYTHMWCESKRTKPLLSLSKDPHPPISVRIHLTLQNSNEFSKAWKCPVGSNMNPLNKCQLW